ncbi:TPA: hypothetical protein JBJ75_05345 [Legionella pneumophila]|nr:hypothetical protein [Legionella pneumophila]
MAYKKIALFIDTNIYLEFYQYSNSDLDSLETLSESLHKKHFDLLINKQLKDEFSKNRATRIKASLDEYKKINFNIKIPTLFSNEIKALQDLYSAKQNYEKVHATLLSKIESGVLNKTLKADLIIDKIFKSALEIKFDKKIYNKAMLRMRCHNPPGKINTLGDALHWESLLSHVGENSSLVIVSNDGDFSDELFPLTKKAHSFLVDEWHKTKKSDLLFYKDLTSFLQDHMPEFKLYDAFKVQISELISDLRGSKSFINTHDVISKLNQYFEHLETRELENIIECYEQNNQINWILEDEDILDFLLRVKDNSILSTEYKDRIDSLVNLYLNESH